MKKFLMLAAAASLVLVWVLAPRAASLQSAGARPLTIDALIDIRHPSSPVWSPDGKHVAFLSERAGIGNIFVSDVGPASTTGTARAVTSYPDGQGAGFFWSRDSQRIYFSREGDLWQVAIAGGAPTAVWSTPQSESGIVMSPDGSRVAFIRSATAPAPGAAPTGRGGRGGGGAGGELIIRTLADGKESLVVRGENRAIGNLSWTPDGKTIVFSDGARTIRHEQTPAYSGSKIIYTISENVQGATAVIGADGTGLKNLGAGFGGGGRRWLDATHFVFDRTSPDFKRRTIYVGDLTGGEPKVLHEDVEEKFWSITGDANPGGQPSPDGKWVLFLSDKDGWDHLYVMPAAGGAALQITKGKFEAWRPQWSPDSTRIAFDANEEGHYGDRQLYVAAINGNPSTATIAQVTSGRGTNIQPTWSPDGTRLVYQHTDAHNSADIWAVDAKPNAKAIRLSDSMPASIDRAAFVEPESVSYKGPDGQTVPAWLFVPKGLDRTKKHPAIVWIHGDGVNQGYDGWHVQRNYAVYYSFHQYLLQKGYVVIMPDYRGSIGYGKAWREGVSRWTSAARSAKDAWMVTNYLKTLPYVDMDRVGVWGLSYGGFFTLIAVTDQPKLFRAAVDVAGVADYAMYYEDPYHGGWTASRIGTPEQNPSVYANASPLSHMDKLERPLLVLHGTSDVNVPYLHSVRLLDKLMKEGKGELVTFMTYPGEFHYFTREHVLRDAWHRVEDFFAANLQAGPVASH